MTTTASAPAALAVRPFTFDLAARAAGDDGIPVVISTDAVVSMPDGDEILVHTAEAVDLQRAPLPIIATHARGQVNVGVVDGLRVAGGQLRGTARFGTRPEAAGYRDDVLGGVIRSVSAGYARIKSAFRIDGVLVTSRWMPSHVALVAEPADVRAGFYRELQALPPLQIDPPTAARRTTQEKSTMDETNAAAGTSAEQQQQSQQPTQGGGQQQQQQRELQGTPGNQALELERARRRAIENLCRACNIADNQRDYWLNSGISVDKVSDDIVLIQRERGEKNPQAVTKLDLSAGEQRRYSITRAIAAAAGNNWSKAGFELECSREISSRMGKPPEELRFFVPFEVQHRQLPVSDAARRALMAQRDLTVASASGGGYLVGTENVSFVEMLRNRSVAFRMGAQRLGGLRGNITVPKQTGAATWYWLSSETTAITESQQTLGQLALSPKTGGAYTEISRQLLLQSTPDAEVMVTADLGRVGGLGVDVAVLRGSGASGEPTGIVNTAGIGSVTGTSLDFAKVLEFQTDIAAANVVPERGGYVSTPAVAALMMQRVKFSGTASPLWEGSVWDGSMCGFGAMSSNQMSAATMLFGDWSSVVVAEWGVLEIEVNPYANFAAGIIGVRAMVSIDVGLRYPTAFSYASSIT